ncbi:hypothetical protein [Devosia nitrariae]|uniref:Uncharacterized protein n=1 Tax=Devosia nitrariae TaxID=2071872 RepID=A0ABQ5W347_9HYPH|nr:hypothetical protein [Devosia nitrariae]GLQ54121.1 hypothetical protein GCM10010862_13800 [Devosia nitrariae]
MEDKSVIGGVSRDDDPPAAVEPAGPPLAAARPSRTPAVIVFVVGLVAVAAIAAAAWVYTETQRDMRRMAADIAQIKLSLELFGRQQVSASPAPADTGADTSVLEALENRLAILEESWRAGSTPAAAVPAEAATDASAGPLTDCVPQDTRFLVTAGDDYAVCGTESRVTVAGVGQSEITFAGDRAIVVGGSMALEGTSCIVAVLSANADGLSGYGEVRVSC